MATIRMTAKGEYCVLLDEPHPISEGVFGTLKNAIAFCQNKGLKFCFGWLDN